MLLHRMLFFLNLSVSWVILFQNAFWDANSFPLRSSIMHSIHQFTMSPNVFRISIRTIPITILCLFSSFTLARHEFAISKYIGTTALNSCPHFFRLILLLLRMLFNSNVTMHIHGNLSFNFTKKFLRQVFEPLLFFFVHSFEFRVFLPLYISPLLVFLFFNSVFVELIYFLQNLHLLDKFFGVFVNCLIGFLVLF